MAEALILDWRHRSEQRSRELHDQRQYRGGSQSGRSNRLDALDSTVNSRLVVSSGAGQPA
jgi:hypothetical protein